MLMTDNDIILITTLTQSSVRIYLDLASPYSKIFLKPTRIVSFRK